MFLQRYNKILFITLALILNNAKSEELFALTRKETAIVQGILTKFTNTNIQMSDFIQRGPKGQSSHGTFYLQRPGKIRFFYKDLPLNIIADGDSVAINNTRLNSWTLYRLAKTPMEVLLSNHLKDMLNSVKATRSLGGEITLKIEINKQNNNSLYLTFDAQNKNLKRWVIMDQEGQPTTIEILNSKNDITFADDMFAIPYQEIAMQRKN